MSVRKGWGQRIEYGCSSRDVDETGEILGT